MIFFCLVRIACQTVSVFYFPTTEVATCSPRLPIFLFAVRSRYDICLHSKVIQDLVEMLDAENGISSLFIRNLFVSLDHSYQVSILFVAGLADGVTGLWGANSDCFTCDHQGSCYEHVDK